MTSQGALFVQLPSKQICNVQLNFILPTGPLASPDQGPGASADSFPPTGLHCSGVTMATFVRLQIQLLGESSSALVAGVQGEVLGDSDLGGARGAAAVILGVLTGGGGGGGGGGALVRVPGDGGADGPWLVLTGGRRGRAGG